MNELTEQDENQKTRAVEDCLERIAMWECFMDASYFDMWAVRRKNNRSFNECIHVKTRGEAEYLTRALNDRDKLRSMCKRAAAEIDKHWESHCNENGLGPSNLLSSLRGDMPPDYYPAYLDT